MTDRRKLVNRAPDNAEDSGRERVSRAAYELFSREGVRAVGVDAVIREGRHGEDDALPEFPVQR